MKFTLNWLKEHLDFTCSTEELLQGLIELGVEIDSCTDYNKILSPFTVAYIKSAEKHPNADSLQVCQVETNQGLLQIVCGAPNARAGIYVIFAKEGTYIPALDVTLKKANIRGVESNGMMLSAKELGISDDHGSIIEFSSGEVGDLASNILGLNDTVVEISLTPNRGDLLGVRGIAKELSSASLGTLKPMPYVKEIASLETSTNTISFQIDEQISKKFILQEIKNVKNVESPKWLQQRLSLIGQNSHNALVDITNYVCFTLNQPLHCYDFNKIKDSSTVSIKFAQDNEKFIGLDEKESTLSSIIPMVTFGNSYGAIGGIKGSLDTSSDLKTTHVLLEGAHFDNKIIALAKRQLNINTESAYRFEREIDVANIELAISMALSLIVDICGGTPLICQKFSTEVNKQTIDFNLEYLNNMAGINFSVSTVSSILEKLNFRFTVNNNNFSVCSPSYRNDINDACVVVAEIIRIYGVNNLPYLSIDISLQNNLLAFDDSYKKQIVSKRSLASLGCLETINMSFISKFLSNTFNMYDDLLVVSNPISEDLSVMRQSLVPSLVNIAMKNINNAVHNFKFFEVSNIYTPLGTEERSASFILAGEQSVKNWQESNKPYNVWEAKRMLYKLIEDLGFNCESLVVEQTNLPSYYHPGKSAKLVLGKNNVIAHFGELHPKTLQKLNLEYNMIVAELFIDRIPLPKNKSVVKAPVVLSAFMPVIRDFAFIIDESIPVQDIIRVIKSSDKKFITGVHVFDLYIGTHIPENKKSIGIQVTLQAIDKTFVDEEIKAICNSIIVSVEKNIGGILRDK